MLSFIPFKTTPTIEQTIEKAVGEKASRRIFYFNEIRERFLAWEVSPERQAEILRKKLFVASKTPKQILHLVDLILMLFNHCQSGFSDALMELKSIEQLITSLVLLKTCSNEAKKLAWLIKLLISSSESLSKIPVYAEEVSKVEMNAFRRDSWVPEMSLHDYHELENSIIEKYGNADKIAHIIETVDKSDDIKMIEKQRSEVKEVECCLMRDGNFLQEIRNSFYISEWPKYQITRMLDQIRRALSTIDCLLAALRSTSMSVTSSPSMSSERSYFNSDEARRTGSYDYSSGLEVYEAKKREVVEKYTMTRELEQIISVIDTTADVEVLKRQYAAVQELQQRLIEDAAVLRDFQRQLCPMASPENPLESLQTQTNTTFTAIENLMKTLEESSQQRRPSTTPQYSDEAPRTGSYGYSSERPNSDCELSEYKMNTEPIDMNTYLCPLCQRIFHSQRLLNTHTRLEHPN
ncbi:zinc finger C2H2 type [Echinococcus multilocularis]|uniref:Zinc finger C2H2 type n=1 Tax=Echinococcus multilocularis TaxID=6211 RepID=A0A068Y2M5_ECHMU|nr:zinc finger C2H2 type [Echinococcus multilocularis]